eukprot:5597716-Amphidinium_carterae.1
MSVASEIPGANPHIANPHVTSLQAAPTIQMMEEEEGFPTDELSPNFGGDEDEDEAMESAEECEPEGEEGLEVGTPTEEFDNPPP